MDRLLFMLPVKSAIVTISVVLGIVLLVIGVFVMIRNYKKK